MVDGFANCSIQELNRINAGGGSGFGTNQTILS